MEVSKFSRLYTGRCTGLMIFPNNKSYQWVTLDLPNPIPEIGLVQHWLKGEDPTTQLSRVSYNGTPMDLSDPSYLQNWSPEQHRDYKSRTARYLETINTI